MNSVISQALDKALPDYKIIAEVRQALAEDTSDSVAQVELDESWVNVPVDAPLTIITKAFFKELYGVGFGIYRAMVAVGDITEHASGYIVPKYCFSTLYYDDEATLIALDFHKELR